jgi:hypothetical protein
MSARSPQPPCSRPRRCRLRAGRRLTLALAVALACGLPTAEAHAEPPRFLVEVEQNQVTMGEPFLVQVNLSISNDEVSDYRPPDFNGLRVLQAARAPNQSTQMQFGAAGMIVEATYSWRYQVAAIHAGTVSIGPARIKVNGQEFRSSVATISATATGRGAAGAVPSSAGASAPDVTGAPAAPDGIPPESAGGGSFIRLVTDKTKAYVGEAIGATWFLYMNQPHDKYDTVVEPRMEGFWTEDVTTPSRHGSLVLTQEVMAGRPYQVGAILEKALFPLKEGRLGITPMEANLSRVDFFGSGVTQHVRSVATTIDVSPLPLAGRPAGFDLASVGRFKLAAHLDRNDVGVGDAVTLTLEISGRGNLRKVGLPVLPRLPGWKMYDPRITVVIDPATGVTGTKSAEVLLLPERTGSVEVPPLVLPFFDPEAGRYAEATAPGFTLRATGGPGAPASAAAAGVRAASAGAASATAGLAGGSAPGEDAHAENVIADDIRPIRTRPLGREIGAQLVHTSGFTLLLGFPPALLLLALAGARVQTRRLADTEGRRQRASRQRARGHLVAAEAHRRQRAPVPFFAEVERLINAALDARLGRSGRGLSTDELRAALEASDVPPTVANRVIDMLETCDRARFAPGTLGDADALMASTLRDAGDLLEALTRPGPGGGGSRAGGEPPVETGPGGTSRRADPTVSS